MPDTSAALINAAAPPVPAAPAVTPPAPVTPPAAPPASPPSPTTLIGGEPPKGTAPEKYDLKLPKDSLLSAEDVERISTIAREKSLSNEDAQARLEWEHEGVSRYAQRQQSDFAKLPDQWLKEVEADKEVGGEKLKENVQIVKAFSQKWLSKETREFLNQSGFGNKLELFRDLVKLARASAPDKAVHGQTTTLAKPKTADELLFPASVGGQKVEE